MALGKQIRKHRDRLGWTLEHLEERSGVSVGTISALEVRDSKRSVYAAPIAKALGVTLEELLSDADSSLTRPPPPQSHPADSWPFCSISSNEWQSLPEEERSEVELLIRAKLKKLKAKSKSAA